MPDFNSRPSARGDADKRRKRRFAASNFNSRPSARGDQEERAGFVIDNISIHAPPRGATAVDVQSLFRAVYFNSRPSARGDRAEQARIRAQKLFQFTPLREGRRLPPRRDTSDRAFQFTPLREGRRMVERQEWLNALFQFTPLREGRRLHCQKGRTRRAISIHAPPRGATVQDMLYIELMSDFNSRPSARGDIFRKPIFHIQKHFNSRPSARGDNPLHECNMEGILFQFTPLREGRHEANRDACRSAYFNSRPSARGDVRKSFAYLICFSISIHAPPRGATSPS